MSLAIERKKFLETQMQRTSIQSAFQHGGIYLDEIADDQKGALRQTLETALDRASFAYERTRTDDEHCHTMTQLAGEIGDQHGHILQNQIFRIGIVQKALNLYLKYLWCLDLIPPPPHCPFDRGIIAQLGIPNPPNFTQIETIAVYMNLVVAARRLSGAEGLGLAEWELLHWG